MFTQLKYLFILVFSLSLTGCDLKLQQPFELVQEVQPITTFENQTVWEWLQTQKSPGGLTTVDQFKFDYLIDAIDYTGLIDEFNRKSDRRTFLLMNNNGFLGTGKLLQALTNKTTGSIRTADKTRLTNALKYHIINQYITQVDPLVTISTNYFFQTLNDGDNGKIMLQRDPLLKISVNPATVAPLTVTRRGAAVRTHNLRYANGIAHVLNDYTRNVAF